ncbi:MAG: threonylcarbamoyl-AMP synthase [Gemmatimonadaceae bacterium]|nr:threonylcarbamoyl-AMP synthase [Gemmatimonadaceae bacterium]
MPTHRVSPEHPDPGIIQEAAALLRRGHLVAFPTETVYGLGAHAMDPQAVARIYAAKGRPAWNPLIVHVATADDVHAVAASWPEMARQLAEAFWPGPLTLVVPKRPDVPDSVTAGLPTVALRVPAHPVAQALLVAAAIPVAAPSANPSMALSPTRASHVARAFGDQVAMILDGGPTMVGIESTVVDVTGERPRLLRPGGIAPHVIEQVVGRLAVPDAAPTADAARSSPGMMERHYAPRARLLVFQAGSESAARQAMDDERHRGGVPGAVIWSDASAAGIPASGIVVRLPRGAAEYARRLYETLHGMDDQGCTLIALEAPPDEPGWEGVSDRVRRAATP